MERSASVQESLIPFLSFVKTNTIYVETHVASARLLLAPRYNLTVLKLTIFWGGGNRPLPSVLEFLQRGPLYQLLLCTCKVFFKKINMPLFSYVLFFMFIPVTPRRYLLTGLCENLFSKNSS